MCDDDDGDRRKNEEADTHEIGAKNEPISLVGRSNCRDSGGSDGRLFVFPLVFPPAPGFSS